MIKQLPDTESVNLTAHCDVEELCKQLDATGFKWDLYRAGMGTWVVTCDNGTRKEAFNFPTIRESMRAALAYRWPRVIPKRPWSFSMAGVAVRKVGNQWEVTVDGRFYMNAGGTKTKVLEQMEKHSRRSVEAAEAWDREYLHVVASGIQWVDWEYEK